MKKTICRFIILCLLVFPGTDAFTQVKKVGAIGIVVSDMDRSLKFYSEVLGFQKISEAEHHGANWESLLGVFGIRLRVATLKLGDESIELVDYLTTGGRSIPEESRSNDLAFQHIAIVVRDMDSAYARLRRFGVPHVSTGPQTLPATIPAAAGIKAFYFQDPDKHNLELIYFPPGKGQEKWQHPGSRLFLGIDHTAIGVSSSGQSHTLYQQVLGIERKGESWNKGTEQEHLNNIEGASLHITGYRSPAGPGIEFLEYIHPGPGKKYPADTRSDDLWSWYTRLEVENAEKMYRHFTSPGSPYRMVSRDLVVIPADGKKKEKSFLVRDPDGHALFITESLN